MIGSNVNTIKEIKAGKIKERFSVRHVPMIAHNGYVEVTVLSSAKWSGGGRILG